MDKYDFIKQLENELSGLSDEEISSAVSYYKELFEDAGSDREQELIKNLGAPKDIAESIKRESGTVAMTSAQEKTSQAAEKVPSSGDTKFSDEKTNRTEILRDSSTIVLLTIIALLTCPVWFPILITFYAVVIVLLFTVVVLAVVFGILGIAGIISGVFVILPIPPIGLSLLGVGLLLTALTIMCVPFLCKGIFHICRAIINGTVGIFHSILYKRGTAA